LKTLDVVVVVPFVDVVVVEVVFYVVLEAWTF
jgi:hypothetical protein